MEISNERLMVIVTNLLSRMYETSECSDEHFKQELTIQIGITEEELEAFEKFVYGDSIQNYSYWN